MATQITVVEATVMSSEMWAGTPCPVFAATKNPAATRNEPAIAATSLHAFTRHQNHRSRWRRPVPAPTDISSWNPPPPPSAGP